MFLATLSAVSLNGSVKIIICVGIESVIWTSIVWKSNFESNCYTWTKDLQKLLVLRKFKCHANVYTIFLPETLPRLSSLRPSEIASSPPFLWSILWIRSFPLLSSSGTALCLEMMF
jgi:hypothetical protein